MASVHNLSVELVATEAGFITKQKLWTVGLCAQSFDQTFYALSRACYLTTVLWFIASRMSGRCSEIVFMHTYTYLHGVVIESYRWP